MENGRLRPAARSLHISRFMVEPASSDVSELRQEVGHEPVSGFGAAVPRCDMGRRAAGFSGLRLRRNPISIRAIPSPGTHRRRAHADRSRIRQAAQGARQVCLGRRHSGADSDAE